MNDDQSVSQDDRVVSESSSEASEQEEEERQSQQGEQNSDGIRGQASEYTPTSRGRRVKKVNYKETANRGRRDTANATVETHESKYHKQRPKTKAQRAKFWKRCIKHDATINQWSFAIYKRPPRRA